ncbi:MAG: PIN domain-containing protein [Trueperaceae bacterium]
MILVDTSVWIGYLRGDASAATDALQCWLDRGAPVALTSLIAQEVLQGIRDDAAAVRVERYLASQRRLEFRDPWQGAVDAVNLYRRCRAAGVTVRSTIDCAVACVALEHDVGLLHDDVDYVRIGAVEPRLRLV